MITQEKRIKWDIFIFIIIIIAAFEIPYSILVGYEGKRIQSFFNYLFNSVFIVDIILNCFTIHEKRYSGFLGWRNIAGIFLYKISPEFIKFKDSSNSEKSNVIINKQPDIMVSYLTSGWFLIDLLAVFPFEMIFAQFAFLNLSRTFRLARIPRILRMIRVLRAIKTVRLLKYFDNIFSINPALGRFVMISIMVPWFAHILSCLLFFFESSPNNNVINSYSDALHFMFVTFTTNNMTETLSSIGYILSIISVVVSFLFIGIFIGNFSSFFEGLDERKAIFEEKKKEWIEIFNIYPEIYNKKMQNEILQYLLDSDIGNTSVVIDKHYTLLRTLDSSLENKIKMKITNIVQNGQNDDLRDLKDIIDKFEKQYSDILIAGSSEPILEN